MILFCTWRKKKQLKQVFFKSSSTFPGFRKKKHTIKPLTARSTWLASWLNITPFFCDWSYHQNIFTPSKTYMSPKKGPSQKDFGSSEPTIKFSDVNSLASFQEEFFPHPKPPRPPNLKPSTGDFFLHSLSVFPHGHSGHTNLVPLSGINELNSKWRNRAKTSSLREAGSPSRPESREAWRATSEIRDDVWSPRWSAQQLQVREEELWTCSTKNHPKKNSQAKKNIQNYWKLTCLLKIVVGRWFMSFKK